jgi:AcrR family transcriptional regulator
MPRLTEINKALLTCNMRNAIRQAMLELLSGANANHISIDMLADRLKVAKGTIYNYFPSKQRIIDDALISVYDSISAEIEEVAARELTPDDKISAYSSVFFRHYDRYKAIYTAVIESDSHLPFRSPEQQHLINRCVELLELELVRGVGSGCFRPMPDPAATALVVFSTIGGMVRLLLIDNRKGHDGEQCRSIFELVVLGALRREPQQGEFL